jgi:hypothetical protein
LPSWKLVSEKQRKRAELREAIAAKEKALGNSAVAGDLGRAADKLGTTVGRSSSSSLSGSGSTDSPSLEAQQLLLPPALLSTASALEAAASKYVSSKGKSSSSELSKRRRRESTGSATSDSSRSGVVAGATKRTSAGGSISVGASARDKVVRVLNPKSDLEIAIYLTLIIVLVMTFVVGLAIFVA